MAKNVLIVYAHHEESSFNAALRDTAVRTLRDSGHQVVVSDLYAMGFNPVIGRQDVKDAATGGYFNYGMECYSALKRGQLAEDIVEELDKLDACDLVIFQFPLQWATVPAILKGWFERVLIFEHVRGRNLLDYDTGRFKGKKAMLSLTTGGPRSWFTENGPHGDFSITLWPLQTLILRQIGFDILEPNIVWGVDLSDKQSLEESLNKWERRLRHDIWDENVLYYVPGSSFKLSDPQNPFSDFEKLDDTLSARDYGANVGHHMGKPIPPDSMMKSPPTD